MLTDIIENAPFIDVVLDEEPEKSGPVLLNPGFNREHASSQLFPSILKARIALATHKEAYRNLREDLPAIQHQKLLEAVFSCRLDGHVSSVANPLRSPDKVDDVVLQRAAVPDVLPLMHKHGMGLQFLHKLSQSLVVENQSQEPIDSLGSKDLSSKDHLPANDLFRDSPLGSSKSFSTRVNPPANRSDIDRLLRNWVEYVELAGRQTEPLVVVAVAYYQMLAISPFLQGNPAVARMTLQLLLIDMGLTDQPVLGLSREILLRETEHRLLFEEVALTGNWHNWLIFCSDLIYRSAERSSNLLHTYEDIETDVQQNVRSVLPKLVHEELTSLLFLRPVCRIRDLVERGVAKRQTASVYLKALATEGVLAEEQRGKEKWFFNNRYLSLFD